MVRRRYPNQHNIPSQNPERRIPYFPGQQQDIAQLQRFQPEHESDPGKGAVTYVVSTFDARPINAIDFSVYSGTNDAAPGNPDTAVDPTGGPYPSASLFYRVPENRTAIIRDWHVLIVPETGFLIGETAPIIALTGASNYAVTLSFLVNGIFQQEMSNRVLWALPFGDVFGDAYIIANAGDLVEMRVTGGIPGTPLGITQGILAMHGNLLVTKGYQQQFEPGTDAILPVTQNP